MAEGHTLCSTCLAKKRELAKQKKEEKLAALTLTKRILLIKAVKQGVKDEEIIKAYNCGERDIMEVIRITGCSGAQARSLIPLSEKG